MEQHSETAVVYEQGDAEIRDRSGLARLFDSELRQPLTASMASVSWKAAFTERRQFTGRRQHQHLWLLLFQVEIRKDRQCKGRGFAGAGLRLSKYIPTLQQ